MGEQDHHIELQLRLAAQDRPELIELRSGLRELPSRRVSSMMRTCVRMAGRKRKDETDRKPSVELDRSYGRNLRRIRQERGYSQEALAFRAEVHRTEISLLERGKRDPGVNMTLRLAGALGVDPGELLAGAAFAPSEDGREARFTYDPAPKPQG